MLDAPRLRGGTARRGRAARGASPSAPAAARARCSSTTTTTCSRPSRSSCGRRPPFEPALRDGKLFGRGVSDDKGHLTARLLAIDALLAVSGELPCRVKFVIEGEEEVGSVHLPAFVREQPRAPRGRRVPVGVRLRGSSRRAHAVSPDCAASATSSCRCATATVDVHSGLGGSILPNAAWRLTWALASLKGPDERIRIPGHYDSVRPPTARDRELMAALPDSAHLREHFGVNGFLRGMTGGDDMRDRRGVRAHLHDLRARLGLPGPGLEDRAAGAARRPRWTSASCPT